MRILIDGVFFQLNNTGIARLWRSILEIMVVDKEFEIYFLDRGNAPQFDNINYINFPSYDGEHAALDSFEIQKVCDYFSIDIFTSSYYTTPISTPMILFVYDMIPELFSFDISHRMWREKMAAICYADKFICISDSTKNDLLNFYPELDAQDISIAYCGLDALNFKPRDSKEINSFVKNNDMNAKYFMFVGSREQNNGYKNSALFFNALKSPSFANQEFDILCVGGEKIISPDLISTLPKKVSCKRVELTDYELSVAYSGALGLIYPSLYEGFGMPVIEAMSCGCPVITTNRGSLKEAAGDAALFVDGYDVPEMVDKLTYLLTSNTETYVRRGFLNAKRFIWLDSVHAIKHQYQKINSSSRFQKRNKFLNKWRFLRSTQCNVDYLIQRSCFVGC